MKTGERIIVAVLFMLLALTAVRAYAQQCEATITGPLNLTVSPSQACLGSEL